MNKLFEYLRKQGLTREKIDQALDEFFPETLEEYRDRQEKEWRNKVKKESVEDKKGSLVLSQVEYQGEVVRKSEMQRVLIRDINLAFDSFLKVQEEKMLVHEVKPDCLELIVDIIGLFANNKIAREEFDSCFTLGIEKGGQALFVFVELKENPELKEVFDAYVKPYQGSYSASRAQQLKTEENHKKIYGERP